MPGPVPIALAITGARLDDFSGQMAEVEHWAEKAARKKARYLIFPEMHLTGYATDAASLARSAVSSGKVLPVLSRISARWNLVLLCGFAEKGEHGFFASHAVVFPTGETGIYRKIHLGPPERGLYTEGSAACIFPENRLQKPVLTFGIQLCYDAHFPELSTHMAVSGCDLICIPHASPRGTPAMKRDSWMRHLPARAFDTGTYVAAVNPVGSDGKKKTYPGIGLVIGPDGRVVDELLTETPALLFSSIDPEKVAKARSHRMTDFLSARRPDLYGRFAGFPFS